MKELKLYSFFDSYVSKNKLTGELVLTNTYVENRLVTEQDLAQNAAILEAMYAEKFYLLEQVEILKKKNAKLKKKLRERE